MRPFLGFKSMIPPIFHSGKIVISSPSIPHSTLFHSPTGFSPPGNWEHENQSHLSSLESDHNINPAEILIVAKFPFGLKNIRNYPGFPVPPELVMLKSFTNHLYYNKNRRVPSLYSPGIRWSAIQIPIWSAISPTWNVKGSPESRLFSNLGAKVPRLPIWKTLTMSR